MRFFNYPILFIILLSTLKTAAQPLNEKDFTLYSIKEGLTDNRVTAVAQDMYGYIWAATQKGLNRFDGHLFQSFYSDTSATSLPEDGIVKLKWLDKEQLGVSTYSGLHIVNTRSLQTRNLIIPSGPLKYEYKVNVVQDMTGDANGNIFILTRSGFYHYNKKDELVFRYDHYKKEQEENEVFVFGRNMALTDNGLLLLSTINGLYFYNTVKKNLSPVNSHDDAFYHQVANPGEWFYFKHSDPNSFSMQADRTKEIFYFDLLNKTRIEMKAPFKLLEKFSWRSALFKLSDSLFAITGREKGFYLVKYNREKNIYDIYPHLYFENYFCSSLLTDKNKRLWIGTNKGLFRENSRADSLEKITVPPEMNPFNLDLHIRDVTVANNKLFIATLGEGLLIFDKETLKPLMKIDCRQYPGIVNNAFYTITLNKDTVLAGSPDTLFYINTNTLLHTPIGQPGWKEKGDWISSLFKDSRNNIYAGSAGTSRFYFKNADRKEFRLASYPANPYFSIEIPHYITEDPEGNIWFSGHGISRFNFLQQKFDLQIDSFPKIKIRQRAAKCLLFDTNGKMYFGVPENGLIIYDPVKKTFEQFTRNDGLPDNNISALYLHKNTLWLGTESGLASFDIATKKIFSYGVSDHMPEGPFTGKSFYFDLSEGQLYGSFNNTILRFNPDKLTKNNSSPDFFIESLEIADEKIIYHPGNRIELSYKQNSLVVNLAAINFEDAYQQQFAYRFVENGDEPWRQTGSQRNIIFSDLSQGNHTLQLKVFIKNNSWSEQVKEIDIYIRPPFWQTTWFKILAAALLISLLYILYRYRIKSIRQKANIDKQLAELEMKGLHAQMNPHFIFNSLNSIREMILNDENKDASHFLSKFARLIRLTLNQSGESFISLRNTTDYLHRYLEMEQIRNKQFTYVISMQEAPDPDETMLPPMLIQPFIENAIWHGVSPGHRDIHIRIDFKKEQDNLVCTIDDNGIGIIQSLKEKDESDIQQHPVGISNIQQRVTLLNEKYKIRCSITIKDKTELAGSVETGTIVTLKLPLEIKGR